MLTDTVCSFCLVESEITLHPRGFYTLTSFSMFIKIIALFMFYKIVTI